VEINNKKMPLTKAKRFCMMVSPKFLTMLAKSIWVGEWILDGIES